MPAETIARFERSYPLACPLRHVDLRLLRHVDEMFSIYEPERPLRFPKLVELRGTIIASELLTKGPLKKIRLGKFEPDCPMVLMPTEVYCEPIESRGPMLHDCEVVIRYEVVSTGKINVKAVKWTEIMGRDTTKLPPGCKIELTNVFAA